MAADSRRTEPPSRHPLHYEAGADGDVGVDAGEDVDGAEEVGVGVGAVGVGVGVVVRVGVGVGVGFREADGDELGDADLVGDWDEYTDGDAETPADWDVPGNDDALDYALDEGDAPREVEAPERVRPAVVDPVGAEICAAGD